MVRALPDIYDGGRELRSPMSLASRRTHMLSRRQASLLSSGIAYCELCCVLIALGIQRSQSLPTQRTHPGVQPVRLCIRTLWVSIPLSTANVVLGSPKTFE